MLSTASVTQHIPGLLFAASQTHLHLNARAGWTCLDSDKLGVWVEKALDKELLQGY